MTAVVTGFTSLRRSRPARFSFVYWIRNGRGLIVDHHSSVVTAPSP